MIILKEESVIAQRILLESDFPEHRFAIAPRVGGFDYKPDDDLSIIKRVEVVYELETPIGPHASIYRFAGVEII